MIRVLEISVDNLHLIHLQIIRHNISVNDVHLRILIISTVRSIQQPTRRCIICHSKIKSLRQIFFVHSSWYPAVRIMDFILIHTFKSLVKITAGNYIIT